MEIGNCSVKVITLKEDNGDWSSILKQYRKLRNEGYEVLNPIGGEYPHFYGALYKPTKRSLTLFE